MFESTDEAHILIVDDNPINLDLLAQLLRSHRFHVRAVPSGSLAIESARLSPPDLILLDIKMPDMDGYETCRALKAEEELQEIPVIFISALDDAWDKVKAFQVGGVDYLTKPFYAEEVLIRVQHQILLRHLQKQLVEKIRDLEHANMKLLEMDNMKAKFTAMLVHDLRSPISSLSLVLDIYEEVKQIPDPLFQGSRQTLQQMQGLITDLLDVFRGGGGALVPELQSVQLSDITSRVHQAFLPQASRLGITLDLQVPSPLGEVSADPKLVERALGNLIGNALKYTPTHGTILLTAEEIQGTDVEKDQRWVALKINDSGRGIPADKLPFIFDPFQQVSMADTHVGFGLGLAIVQRIMAAHHGRVVVQSQVGVGTTFTMLFPLAEVKLELASISTAP